VAIFSPDPSGVVRQIHIAVMDKGLVSLSYLLADGSTHTDKDISISALTSRVNYLIGKMR
jgi:hypothetical protein